MALILFFAIMCFVMAALMLLVVFFEECVCKPSAKQKTDKEEPLIEEGKPKEPEAATTQSEGSVCSKHSKICTAIIVFLIAGAILTLMSPAVLGDGSSSGSGSSSGPGEGYGTCNNAPQVVCPSCNSPNPQQACLYCAAACACCNYGDAGCCNQNAASAQQFGTSCSSYGVTC